MYSIDEIGGSIENLRGIGWDVMDWINLGWVRDH
jgi:hypothetical protein